MALSFGDFLGLEIDASGRSKKTVSTSVATSSDGGVDYTPTSEPTMASNDMWSPLSDSLLLYA